MDVNVIAEKFGEHASAVRAVLATAEQKSAERAAEQSAKLAEVETAVAGVKNEVLALHQKGVRGGGGFGSLVRKSWGDQVVADTQLKEFAIGARDRARIEVKAVTSSGTSGGPLAPPTQLTDPVVIPRTVLRVRDLPRSISVDSGVVLYPRMVSRDLNPTSVAEGALKPASDLHFETVSEPIRTLAHHITASKQIISDSGAVLRSVIDAELVWGLKVEEDRQLMLGSGAGEELHGMLPQASTYVPPVVLPAPITGLDMIAGAIAQLAIADFAADAIVLHPADWLALRTAKDSEARYLLSPPNVEAELRLYGLPCVISKTIPAGTVLVGAFKQSTVIFDREQVVILVSFENNDNFVKNNVTFLCEERLGFSVTSSAGLVKATLPAPATRSSRAAA
jgi:HK97 family phage major capsid protein